MAAPKPLNTSKYNSIKKEVIGKCVDDFVLEARDGEDFIRIPKDFDGTHLLKNDKNEEFFIIPVENIDFFINAAKQFEEEKFLFELEKELIKEMPIDFDDVWCIVQNEHKNNPKKNPKNIITFVKKEHPYLFFNEIGSLLNSLKQKG